MSNGHNQTFGNMDTLQLLVENMLPDTLYKFRIRATSHGGHGPWSEYFESVTLKDGECKWWDGYTMMVNASGGMGTL